MLRFITARLLQAVLVLLTTITITFFLIRMAPGSPFMEERNYTPETIARLNKHYGFDQPLHIQYFRYLGRAVRGDLGPSTTYANRTVNDVIAEAFPESLELGFYALLLAFLVGTGAGVAASLRPNSARDYGVMGFAMTGICLPSFVLGPVLILIFAVGLGWLQPSGWHLPSDRILPTITLASAYIAYIARLTRGSMLETWPQDYIRTARAKGLSELRVTLRHALRNAILPIVSFLGPAAAGLITGSFVVETIFHIPGLGRQFVQSAFNRDYSLVLGLVAFYAAIIVIFNTAVDIALSVLDPRIRRRAA